jgi:hypothetical protein
MMAASMASVVELEPEPEIVPMAVEVHLVYGYQSCHWLAGELWSFIDSTVAEPLIRVVRQHCADEAEECHRYKCLTNKIIDGYDLPLLPFIYTVRGYRILNLGLILYYFIINFISLIGSAETHAGELP